MGISAIRLLARKWSNAGRPGYNPQQHHAQVVTMRSMVTGMMSTLNTASHDAHYSSDSDSQASINNEKATLQTMKNSLDKLSTTTATPTAEPTDYPTAAPTDAGDHCVRIVTGTGGDNDGDLSLEVRIADGNALDHANEAWPAGFCLSNGNDQNSGVIKLDGGNYEGNTKEAQCLAQCKEHSADWTGCEVIWDQGNAGCYVHTEHVNSANSYVRHKCLLRGEYDAATAASAEPTATAANGQSWTDSQQVCTNQGKQLCTFDKICPNGEGSTPVDGGSSVGHDWSPMLRADGVTNDWVHISGSGHSNCKPHGKYHGLPGWGTQPSNTYNHRIYCCGQPSTATSEDMPVKCYQLQHPSRKWEQGEQAGAFYYTGISASQYTFKPVCLLSFGKMNERKVRYMCGDCSEVSCCPNTLGQNDQTWTTTTDANTCSVQDNSGFRKCKAADTNIAMRHLSYKSEEQCTPYYMGSANIQEKCGYVRPPPPPDCTNAARLASGCTWMIQKYGKANICTEGFVGCPCDCP